MAKAALPFFPLPNQSGLDYTQGNIRDGIPEINDLNTYTGKIDHHFSDKDILSGSYSFIDQTNTQSRDGYGGTPTAEIYFNKGTSRTQTLALSETHVFSPNMVNDARIGFTRPHDRRGPPIRTPARTTVLNLPNATGDTGWPCLVPSDQAFNLDAGLHFDDDNPQTAPQVFTTGNDNLSIVRGTHHFSLGGNFRALTINSDERGQPRGCYSFWTDSTGLEGPDGTALPGTGSGLASFLLGIPDDAELRSDKGFFYHRQKEFQTYIQDDWKLNSRLTLNLGLRYELYTRYKDKRNQIATFDPVSGAIVTALPVSQIAYPPAVAAYEAAGAVFKTASEVGFPRNLLEPDHDDFAPRVGLAYRLNEKTVLRGGYGIYYWTTPLITLQAPSRQNPPFNFTRIAANGDSVVALETKPAFIMGMTPPDQIFSNTQISIQPNNVGLNPFDPNMRDSWVDEWNVTVERELASRTSLRLSYVGARGHNLQIKDPINSTKPKSLNPGIPTPLRRQFPLYGNMSDLKTLGFSQNHQFQVEVKRTTQRGIIAQGYYVFQKTLDTSEFGAASCCPPGVLGAAESGISDLDKRIRLTKGPSSFEFRHRLTLKLLIDLPFGPGHRWGSGVNPALGKLIGGWQIASISTFHSGSYFSNGFGNVRGCDGNLPSGQRTLNRWFDTSCFVRSDSFPKTDPRYLPIDQLNPGRPGRNVLVGPGFANADFAIFKNTSVYEKASVRFTADFFNFPNHPSLGNPDPVTGLIDSQANGPRIIQLGLRVEF